jgi:hypothetical protein
MNFFKDMLGKAFDNDGNLSQADKLSGMIDGAESEPTPIESSRTLTATQQKWRQKMLDGPSLQATDLTDTTISLDLFLTGVPNKDPSNDLFGSKVNISSRDRQIGLMVPKKATLSNLEIIFLTDGKCQCIDKEDSGFVLAEPGDWVLSEDGKQVRFRFAVAGYTRRVETKGTIQKVKISEASTIYNIPEGWLYGEADLSGSSNKQKMQWDNCILKVEKSLGLLGATSKMVPCGKFIARTIDGSSSL